MRTELIYKFWRKEAGKRNSILQDVIKVFLHNKLYIVPVQKSINVIVKEEKEIQNFRIRNTLT